MGISETGVVSVESFKLRDLGNSYGFTVSMSGLEELGLVDSDGDLIDDEIEARGIVFEDGTVSYEIALDEVQNKSLSDYSA